MPANNFVFYGSNMETLDRLKTQPELRSKLIEAILSYGCYGEYDQSDPVVCALMANIEFGITNAQTRYKSSKEVGTMSHGNSKYSHSEIVELFAAGRSMKDIAATIGCDLRTVQRHVKMAKDRGELEPEKEILDSEPFRF